MGLYDDRLADLSETRKRVAVRRSPPTSVQSLLFRRDAGWTVAKAKSWAHAHGHKYGKVDVTDQYIRLRQFDPKGSKVKRTIPFGKGIRAVIAREESMAKARRSRSRSKTKGRKSAKRRAPRRKTRRVKAAVVASRPRRRHRRAAKVTRRRRVRTPVVATPIVVAAPRKRRRVKRRAKRRASHVMAWRGDKAGHAKAARKGHKRRKARKSARRKPRRSRKRAAKFDFYEAPKRRRSRRKMRAVAAPKRRRHRRHHRGMRMFASSGGGGRMTMGELATAVLFGGIGYVAADAIDRLLATYNPLSTTAPAKDKFTSTGAGTLANTLNVASRPSFMRIGAGVGMVIVPVGGAMLAKRSPMARSALEGMAVGTSISLFKTFWNNLIMPMLTPSDTSPASLQKSYIARLYPAEVAAHVNMQAQQLAVASATSGALSGPADVGPFALSGDSPYPDAAQALRNATGVQDSYPTVQQVYGTGGDSPYPTATQALRNATGVSEDAPWQPGPPTTPGPGPQPEGSQCGCVGDPFASFSSFLGDSQEAP